MAAIPLLVAEGRLRSAIQEFERLPNDDPDKRWKARRIAMQIMACRMIARGGR